MDELIPLSLAHLNRLPRSVARPRYERSELTPGIVHIGVGNFHRAHQAWYLHRLMQTGEAHDWGILGAGVRHYDAVMRDKLLAQDCLTTLIELDPAGVSAEVIGSMIDYIPVEEGNGPLIEAMADPAIRIVALTVTEGGYYIDPVTNAFDAAHGDIKHDADQTDAPITAFGAIVAALKARRNLGLGPLSVLSCDNLQGNGAITRQAIVSLAALSDPDLADWIDTNCTFPNSMVDCIVPATGPEELAMVHALGIADAVPVTHENFRQWVIEDDFCAGRPAWEKVGATITRDVHAYEAMKLRMLNAGHQVLANAGEILGLETIADCMADPAIRGFFEKVQIEEILPIVQSVPGMSPRQYLDLITQRFANPSIKDTTRRVAFDGSARHTGFVLPTVRDAMQAGADVMGLALVEALWARMCFGTREDGSTIEANDPNWADLNAAARASKTNPMAWLQQSTIYGDLAQATPFTTAFAHWLPLIWQEGAEAAIEMYCAATEAPLSLQRTSRV
ncbi:MAG: mannitol dehydrogenase family protein [Hyphomicrobiales bacterium]|jgi:mannitol 2-dehydrogenase